MEVGRENPGTNESKTREKLVIWIDKPVVEKLRAMRTEEDVLVSGVIRRAINEYLERREAKAADVLTLTPREARPRRFAAEAAKRIPDAAQRIAAETILEPRPRVQKPTETEEKK